MGTFEVKVRQVGTSLGELIPKEEIREEKIKKDQTIRVSIIKKDLKLIDKMFGSAPHAGPFIRDRRDRLERL